MSFGFEHEIEIRGEIGPDKPVNIASVRKALGMDSGLLAHVDRLKIVISSVGGELSEAESICCLLSSIQKPIVAHARGEVSSAAILLLLTAQLRTAEKDTRFLVHDCELVSPPRGRLTSKVLQAAADNLRRLENLYYDIVHLRTGHDRDWFVAAGDEERMLDVNEALACGLIHASIDAWGLCNSDWPAELEKLDAEGSRIVFPERYRTPQFLAACRLAPPFLKPTLCEVVPLAQRVAG